MKANDPVNPQFKHQGEYGLIPVSEGLTVRNHIAIEAMKGILASHAHPQSFGTPSTEEEIRKLTSDSYTIADAMIETSNKETTP